MTMTITQHSIRGLDYCVRTAGQAGTPVIVLLHGLFDTGASFTPMIQALRARHGPAPCCIAPDWRGHGDSARAPQGYWFPDYLADLDALLALFSPARPVILIGHSMGGQVASLYAGTRPERVQHLVTLDSLNVPDAPTRRTPERYRNWLDGLQRAPAERTYASVAELGRRIGRRYPELSSELCLYLADNWTRPMDDGRVRLACDPCHRLPFPYGFRAEEACALWRQVRAPTLCLDAEHGLSGHSVDAHTMAARRACFHRLTHRIIPGCGHMLHIQAADAVASSVATWLSQVMH